VVGFTASGPMASGSSLDFARLTLARPSVSSTTMTRPQSPYMAAHECLANTEYELWRVAAVGTADH